MNDLQLYRSSSNAIFAGVCGGLAERFNIDPVIVRALFAFATLAGFSGVAVYIVLWIVMPVK